MWVISDKERGPEFSMGVLCRVRASFLSKRNTRFLHTGDYNRGSEHLTRSEATSRVILTMWLAVEYEHAREPFVVSVN